LSAASVKTESAEEVPQQQPVTAQQQTETPQQQPVTAKQQTEIPQQQPVTAQQQTEIPEQQSEILRQLAQVLQQQSEILRQQSAILQQQAVTPPPSPQPQPQPQSAQAGGIILEGAFTYTVMYQDTLAHIAEWFYGRGNGYYYGLIMLASHITDPDTITRGTRLVIPDLMRNLANPDARSRLKAYSLEIADMLARQGFFGDARNMRVIANAL
jgi:hypothetical protein